MEPRQLTFVFADSPKGGKGSRLRDESGGRPYLLHNHCRLHVVDDDPFRHTSEKLPRLFQSIDDDVQLLRETHVNVLVAAEAKSDEQRPDQSIPIRLRVVDLAELTKIHFGELTR